MRIRLCLNTCAHIAKTICVIAAFLLAPRFVIAKNTFKVPANPGSFDAVKNIIGFDEYEPPHLIPKELKKAQCGGWDFTDTISTPDGKLEASKIPEVKGLPGHQVDKLFDNRTSGMAVREEELSAPGNAANEVKTCGYMSTCRPGGTGAGRY